MLSLSFFFLNKIGNKFCQKKGGFIRDEYNITYSYCFYVQFITTVKLGISLHDDRLPDN